MMDPPHRPHIVAIPFPAQGHVNPMMQLSKILASKGFMITFINAGTVHERLVQCRYEERLASTGVENIRLEHVPLPGLSQVCSGDNVTCANLAEAAEKMGDGFDKVIERITEEQPPITCIISDIMMSTATHEVADKYRIPRIVFFTSSQSVSIFFFHLHKGLIPDAMDLDSSSLPGLPPLSRADIPTFILMDVDDTEYMYNFLGRQFKLLPKADRALVNTLYDLESRAIDVMSKEIPLYPIGPLLPEDRRSGSSLLLEQDECLQWLDKQPVCSVLYVSLGSTTILSVPQFKELAHALEHSHQRFLWVIRPRQIDGIIPDKAMQDLIARTKDRAFFVSWAPQMLVLGHPSVSAFLTHCGWNSVMESIYYGVPMFGWPYFADQIMNRKFIVDVWKIGMDLAVGCDGILKSEEMGRVIRAMVEGDEGKEVRRRAIKLSDAARNSLKEDGGNSYINLEDFVKDMSRKR